jgi:hypothetical protein
VLGWSVLAALTTAMAGAGAVGLARGGGWSAVEVLVGAGGIAACAALAARTRIVTDDEGITIQSALRRHCLTWDQVERVQVKLAPFRIWYLSVLSGGRRYDGLTCWVTLYPFLSNISWSEYDVPPYGTPPVLRRAFEAVALQRRAHGADVRP